MTLLESVMASVTASAVVTGGITWFLRTWITERLRQAIAHEYAEKLERHKAELAAATSIEVERFKFTSTQEATALAVGQEHLRDASRAIHTKSVEATERLWASILHLGRNPPEAVAHSDYCTEAEIQSMGEHEHGRLALKRLSMDVIKELLERTDSARERLVADEYLYALFDGYRTLVARSAFIMLKSRDLTQVAVWYNDSIVREVLAKVFSASEVSEFDAQPLQRLTWVRDNIEKKFLEAARQEISGHVGAVDAVRKARDIQGAAAKAVGTIRSDA